MSQSGLSHSKLYLIPVNRFTTSELPHFKQKIVHHKHALSKLEANGDWQGVHQEQIKASATLKKLKRSLQDLENVKSRLDVDQQPDFEQLLIPVRENARKSIEDFAAFQERVEAAAAAAANTAALCDPSSADSAAESGRQDLLQRQLVLDEQQLLQRRQEQLAAFENLERDAADLHEIFADLATMTAEQREQVDLVEDNVATAQENVTEGARQLAAAARLSGGVAPVAGAVIGGLVAGPLGLMVGAKVGSVAAVSGGLLGYFGGRIVNTARRSGPDIPDPPPRSASAPADLDSPLSSAPGALRRLRAALARRLAGWLGSEWVGAAVGLGPCCGMLERGGGGGGGGGPGAARGGGSGGAAGGGAHDGGGGGHASSNSSLAARRTEPYRVPEQPVDPLLAEDAETAEDAGAVAVVAEPPAAGEVLPQPLPELVTRPVHL